MDNKRGCRVSPLGLVDKYTVKDNGEVGGCGEREGAGRPG